MRMPVSWMLTLLLPLVFAGGAPIKLSGEETVAVDRAVVYEALRKDISSDLPNKRDIFWIYFSGKNLRLNSLLRAKLNPNLVDYQSKRIFRSEFSIHSCFYRKKASGKRLSSSERGNFFRAVAEDHVGRIRDVPSLLRFHLPLLPFKIQRSRRATRPWTR